MRNVLEICEKVTQRMLYADVTEDFLYELQDVTSKEVNVEPVHFGGALVDDVTVFYVTNGENTDVGFQIRDKVGEVIGEVIGKIRASGSLSLAVHTPGDFLVAADDE